MIELARLLENKEITFVTGAGVSAASGLPLFRDENGEYLRDEYEVGLAYQTLGINPTLVWDTLASMAESRRSKNVTPNEAHFAISGIIKATGNGLVLTQNIDGLHQAAGLDESEVIEIHGSMKHCVCPKCATRYDLSTTSLTVGDPPRCVSDRQILWPGVTLLGQKIPSLAREAMIERVSSFTKCSTVIFVGTQATYAYLRGIAKEAVAVGGNVAVIGLGGTNVDDLASVKLEGRAEDLLPNMLEQLRLQL